jgi:hypothetical protein
MTCREQSGVGSLCPGASPIAGSSVGNVYKGLMDLSEFYLLTLAWGVYDESD